MYPCLDAPEQPGGWGVPCRKTQGSLDPSMKETDDNLPHEGH